MSTQDNRNLNFDKEYDIVIIGAGIGGLLTAANLVKTGKKVCIIEKLGFIGGRFTSIPYKGFEISTGALHLLPYGATGPMGKMLRRLTQQSFIKLKNNYFLKKNRNEIQVKKGIPSYIDSVLKDRLRVVSATLKYVQDGRPTNYSALEYLTEGKVSEDTIAHLRKFTNFTLSMDLDEISAYQLGNVSRNFIRYWKPGLIKGGCGHVIEKLIKLLEVGNIKLRTNIMAQKIIIEDGAVIGVVASKTINHGSENNEIKLKTKNIVSDIGPKATAGLIPNDEKDDIFWSNIKNIREAKGFKFHLKVKKLPVKDAGVVFPLQSLRIGGFSVVSNGDRSLAPKNSNLLIAHAILKSKNTTREVEMGISDLEKILGSNFKYEDILSIGIFKDTWPVNRAKHGDDVSFSTPIKGLYLVGDGCKPLGFPMAEGVANSVNNLLKHTDLLKQT